MIGKGYIVENDLYAIAARLKEIDEGYFVFRRYRPARYEVHHREQKGGTLALVVPYKKLDARTLTLVRRTGSHRRDILLRELDEANRLAEKHKLNAVVKDAGINAERRLAAL